MVNLAERVADADAMAGWLDTELRGTAAGHRDLAGSLIAYRFSSALAELTMALLVDHGRGLVVSAEDVWIELVDGVRTGAVALTIDDTTDDQPAEATARTLVAVFGPLADAVRALAPFGRPGMWGTLVDHVAERATQRDRQRGWGLAAAVTDEVGRLQPWLRGRPRPYVVAGGHHVEKGTCCLIYKADPTLTATKAQQISSYACSACPLRDERDRRQRITAGSS
jgi:hypothetical protein